MRVVLSAGGTAGHVSPALAIAQTLQAEGTQVYFAGTPNSIEERLVKAAGIEFASFSARGFNRRKPWTVPATLLSLSRGRSAAKRWLKQIKPQVVATFGGYASLPTGLAAASLRLRLLVHEQNARPGLANRVLARRADVLALTDERAATDFKTTARIQITGNPLRPELLGVDRQAARERLGFTDAGLILLIFGGSLGAHHLNSAVLNLATELLADSPDLQVLHLTGSLDYQWANQMFVDQQIPAKRWHLMEYCHQMGDAYAAADLVLSRAGASSLAEITALGKAALLVPYPYAVADEQTANAQKLEEADAARVWPDRELENPGFSELLKKLLADPLLRQSMADRALALSKPDANRAITQLILELVTQPEIVQPTGE